MRARDRQREASPSTAATQARGELAQQEVRREDVAVPEASRQDVSGDAALGYGRPVLPPDVQALFDESFRRNEAGLRYLIGR